MRLLPVLLVGATLAGCLAEFPDVAGRSAEGDGAPPDAAPPALDVLPPADAGPDAAVEDARAPEAGADAVADAGEPDAAPDAGAPDAAVDPDAAETGERCNGLDDDGDGRVDEGYDLGEPCSTGLGPCRADGLVICLGPAESGCSATAGVPEDEVCNGLDDDCDGEADEDFAVGLPCAAGAGLCQRLGAVYCDDRGLAACDAVPAEPQEERCNQADDDCDGIVDEGFAVGEPCSLGQGACRAEGAWACDEEGRAHCDALPGEARPEACNAADDDCDGAVDEDFLLGEACVVGVGACRAEGVTICGGDGVRCDTRPAAPVPERCNAIDDDCDGEVDEDFALGSACHAGVGACRGEGVVICGEGEIAKCTAVPGAPVAERCNGADDDCDGETDEDFGVGAACTAGLGPCRAEGVVACVAADAAACDAVAGEPAGERCNDVDDDCDGRTDEDFPVGEPCEVGVGACHRTGTFLCQDDAAACSAAPGEPAEEVCNGVDDDCDGGTDEGLLNACGECGPLPQEACNGLDDDCDGQVDEQRVCGPYIQNHCRVWLGSSDANATGDGPVDAWGDCPGQPFDNVDDVRCTSTQLDGRFRVLRPDGDLNADDRFALAFTCADPRAPEQAEWVQTHCAVFLGWADLDGGPDNSATWGACPPAHQSNAGNLRCTSSGYDGRFRALLMAGNADGNDDFGIAFICQDPAAPARALAAAESVEVIFAWSRYAAIPDGAESWSGCPQQLRDESGDNRCVSSAGDQRFHRVGFVGNLTEANGFGIALRAR